MLKIPLKIKKIKKIIAIDAGHGGKDPGAVGKRGTKEKNVVYDISKRIFSELKKYKNVKILWASVREPYNYLQASQLGCHIITVPPNIISKIENFGKSFKSLTRDTVKTFLVDSRKSNFSI